MSKSNCYFRFDLPFVPISIGMNCAIVSKLSKNFSDIPINYQFAETVDIYGFEPSLCAFNADIILNFFEELPGDQIIPFRFGIAKVKPFLKLPNFFKDFLENLFS